MDIFSASFARLSSYQELCQAFKTHQSPISYTGLSDIHKAHFLTAFSQEASPVLVVMPEEAQGRRLCEDINALSGETIAMLFPAKELILTPTEGATAAYEQARIAALSGVLHGTCRILVASAESILQPTIAPETLRAHTRVITPGDTLDMAQLAEDLLSSGYVRRESVEGAGQFSVRGDIFDIFPIAAEAPVRMEFWGDTLDTLSVFDVETQRRGDALASVSIPPAREFLFTPDKLSACIRQHADSLRGKHAAAAKETLYRDADQIDAGILQAHLDKYAPIYQEKTSLLSDYAFQAVIFSEYGAIQDAQRTLMAQYREDVALLLEDGNLCRGLEGYYQTPETLTTAWQSVFQIYLSNFFQGSEHIAYQRLLSVEALQNAPWGGETRQLYEDLETYKTEGYCIVICISSEKTLPILQRDLADSGITAAPLRSNSVWEKGMVYLYVAGVSAGFAYPETHLALITQARQAVTRKKRRKHTTDGEEIHTLSDLHPGDLVVHALHGIGRFQGIRKLELEGVTKDYITIQYAGAENLYVPVTQLDLVSRYISPGDDSHVRLHRLSSSEWQKTRTRVRHAVKDMADQLLALYAKREQTPGFAFLPDDDIQREFEARFPYVETEDQLTCTAEIKQDMEKPRPMDRLLCGDVGFGKTEVAFRAAMKCVLSGKQCAILVPTTVLAMQHYQTALQRFADFPVNIAMLSRYVSAKEQKQILADLKSGKIDIIIGTHRLVQKDVEFHSLGLAIVDEEQRFGVAHKERFKEMFAGVDMLTLSATPIPRTLNMAMSGLRDMSVISQPPEDRYPVQTYVLEYNEAVILQAIRRELKRGGQVYYLHNRVDTMEYTAAKLQRQLPDARIAVANGKMTEAQVSEIWRQLIEQEIDVLVCTTIIETGIDVPNVNTLIVEHAERFGLSQMYQLRGRVGRSNRRAYAYFTFPRDKALPEDATKRLNAMREYTKFGSGFQIALRDLEIRGAGSILGGQQHGHMEAVGYDMYLQMLQEAVAEAKGEPVQKTAECVVDVQMDAHIPESYIESTSQRIDMYQKIARVSTEEEESDLVDELIDRYGEPPKEVIGLLTVSRLRQTAANLGITEISQRDGTLYFYHPSPTREMLVALSSRYGARASFVATGKPCLAVRLDHEEPLKCMKEVLETLQKEATL